jgi:TM2 domain-containing membrane protein YozV
LNAEEVDNKEESIRLRVSRLADDKRRLYFSRLEKEIKDPDTYAALNWLLLAGLHHFYLRKYQRGAINLISFFVGAAFLFSDSPAIGTIIIGLIFIFELYELFFSQSIIKQYNNDKSENILLDLE